MHNVVKWPNELWCSHRKIFNFIFWPFYLMREGVSFLFQLAFVATLFQMQLICKQGTLDSKNDMQLLELSSLILSSYAEI